MELLHYLENDSAIFNIMFLIITRNLQFCNGWQDNEYPGFYKLVPNKNQRVGLASTKEWKLIEMLNQVDKTPV